jgi:leukotriene-A4 hydrolase
LIKTIAGLADVPEYTKLRPCLTGEDPDDSFSKVPYEKGSLFLLYLEQLVGGAGQMKAWLKTYFSEFRTRAVDTEMMRAHFENFFAASASLGSIDWDAWLYGVGLPPWDPTPILDLSLAAPCDALARRWLESTMSGHVDSVDAFSETDISTFSSKQKMYFLDILLTSERSRELAVYTLGALSSRICVGSSIHCRPGFN